MVGREREVPEGGEREARPRPAGERAEERVVGEQRGGAPREHEARVGEEVVGGGERGEEGGEAARDEEVRVERAEVGVGREQRGWVTETEQRWHWVGGVGLVHARLVVGLGPVGCPVRPPVPCRFEVR